MSKESVQKNVSEFKPFRKMVLMIKNVGGKQCHTNYILYFLFFFSSWVSQALVQVGVQPRHQNYKCCHSIAWLQGKLRVVEVELKQKKSPGC